MKFLIRDTERTQLFNGQITTYDGLTGKYGVYFPSDGKLFTFTSTVRTSYFLNNSIMFTMHATQLNFFIIFYKLILFIIRQTCYNLIALIAIIMLCHWQLSHKWCIAHLL